MPRSPVDRATLAAFLNRLAAAFDRPGRLYLVGETTQVFEGWRAWTERLHFAAEVAPDARAAFDAAVRSLQAEMGIEVLEESPADVIPLPEGHDRRARPARSLGALQVYHFDPYSVALRLIARGDEPDYHTVLAFLEHDWLSVDEMESLLANVLPRFTSQTIQQDPAEFRRKYKGLLQMWRAVQPEASGP
jgi:hypothetical protein